MGPLAYLIIGLVIGLFVMGLMWSIFGNASAENTETKTEDQTAATPATIIIPTETKQVVDFSETNCKSLEDFRDEINAEVDTGPFSKPYRKVSVDKAKAAALAWASDAVWTEFMIGYPLEGGPALDYHYYSATKGKTVGISFGAGGSSVNTPSTPADYQPYHAFTDADVINQNLWQVTLADAWATAYGQVRPKCGDWWKTISDVGWNVSLHMKDTALVWEFNFFDISNADTTKWTIVVDATKGTILSKSWSEAQVGSNPNPSSSTTATTSSAANDD